MQLDLTWRFVTVWERNMLVFRRFFLNKAVAGLVEPLVMVVGMGFGIGHFVTGIGEVSYVAFVAPGAIASHCMYVAAFETTFGSYTRMTFQKTFDAILATPVSLDEIVAAELVSGATKAAINGTTVLVAVVLFRMVPGVTPLMVFIPLVAFLGGLLFSVIGLLMTSVATNVDDFNYFITLGLTPMFVFSGIFFPIEALPEYAANVAWFTPLMHLVRLSRELALAQPAHVWADLLWLLAAILVLLPWPFMRLRRRLVR